jgi:hypothetical protein
MTQAFDLERVTFYGRSLAEYERMFLLNFSTWGGRSILDAPGGPASFSKEARQFDIRACAVDPQYQHDPDTLQELAQKDIDYVISKIEKTANQRQWSYYQSLEQLKERQVNILHDFIEDYRRDWPLRSHYLDASLPHLPFDDCTFDLALSGHFLFSFYTHFPTNLIIDSLLELSRVAREVRVFPLRSNEQDRTALFVDLEIIITTLKKQNIDVEIQQSGFEFQVGANQLMILKHAV